MTTYNAPEQRYEEDRKNIKGIAMPYALVFLYLALGLGIVAGVGFGWPYLMSLTGNPISMLISLVVAWIGIVVFSLIIGFKAFAKRSVAVLICYLLDSFCWGIALSSTIGFVTENFSDGAATVGIAFGVTAGIFLLMGLFGFIFKNAWKVSFILPFFLFGIMVMLLINMFAMNETVYWITDFVFFGVIMLETMVDFNRIKRLADNGFINSANNLAVYAAYTLLSDYVILLIRILPYLVISRRN